jgi:DNA-binding NarL/FixJ family response regulator
MLLQTGEQEEALEQLQVQEPLPVLHPWRAEHMATEAFALACLGRSEAAEQRASAAEAMTRCIEVKGLVAAGRAVSAARSGDTEGAISVVGVANQYAIWDPVVCALRSSPELAETLGESDVARPFLRQLYERTLDVALARRAGLRTRVTRSAAELLSPRELEVLGLLARGLRNREIAAALYIAESTAKIHVRHVLEKLGVRSRAEAVALYARMIDDTSG